MKIRIREITSTGLEYQGQALPKDLDIAEDFESPVAVKGSLTRVDNFILARLDVSYALDTFCGRCLVKVHSDRKAHYDLEFEIGPRDEYLDIGQAVREELLMACPTQTLCREDCKGICAGCGAELNKEKCKCSEKSMKGSKRNAKSKKTTF